MLVVKHLHRLPRFYPDLRMDDIVDLVMVEMMLEKQRAAST